MTLSAIALLMDAEPGNLILNMEHPITQLQIRTGWIVRLLMLLRISYIAETRTYYPGGWDTDYVQPRTLEDREPQVPPRRDDRGSLLDRHNRPQG